MSTLHKMTMLLGTLCLGLLLVSCAEKTKEKEPKQTVKALAVNIHVLKKETYPIWVTFSGKTQAVDEVMVIARVSGELLKSFFKPGDTVQKDQLLFTIDKSEYQAQWDQKKAILEKDKASLVLALANVRRYKPLVKEQLAPREKLDELVATQKQLEASIRADKAALNEASLDLKYCDVRASIAGKIGKELILKGNIIDKGSELAQIVQTEFLYVNFNPSAHEVALIQKYKSQEKPKVEVRLRGNKKMQIDLEGHIDFIDNVSNTSTGTVAVRAKIANKEHLLFPGTFVEIKLFISDQIPILAVHPDQISQDQQGEFVLLVNEKNEIESRHITSGYSNNDLVVVTKGLKEGDKVIVGNMNGLLPGTVVEAKPVANPINK